METKSAFEKLFASTLVQMGMKESAVITRVMTYGDAITLDKDSKLRLTKDAQNTLKEFVKEATITVVNGKEYDWGQRVRLKVILGDRNYKVFGGFYDQNHERIYDFETRALTEEEKHRVVITFSEKSDGYNYSVYLLDDNVASIDDAIKLLDIN